MLVRTAQWADIPQIQVVRHSVRENRLSDPALVTNDDCAAYLSVRGKGWVAVAKTGIVGYAIVDLWERNIWALFVRPEYEGLGIGRSLHKRMLDWYFSQTTETVWLGTAPGTRAEIFYTNAGWARAGFVNKGEIRFEMTFDNWIQNRKA